MAQLPNMFGRMDQNTGNRPQAPQLPNPVGGAMGGVQSASAGPMGPRPVFSQMGPDNGQHGGRRRYMTPESGAMNQSIQQQQNGQMPPLPNMGGQPTKPYPNQNTIYGRQGGQMPTGVMPRQQAPQINQPPPNYMARQRQGLPPMMPMQNPYAFIGPGGP